ncbi:hypothetical protein DL767_002654 [Monosporascus sp. MG133]|nr:hypothetical protein DL767_002654 [Monosporascus sp. MG133]
MPSEFWVSTGLADAGLATDSAVVQDLVQDQPRDVPRFHARDVAQVPVLVVRGFDAELERGVAEVELLQASILIGIMQPPRCSSATPAPIGSLLLPEQRVMPF